MNFELKTYADPNLFWQEVSPALKREAGLFAQKEFLGGVVVSRYLTNLNLIVTPVGHHEHAKTLFEAAAQANLAITGVVGESATASYYRDCFEQMGKQTKTLMAQAIYKRTQVKMPLFPKDLKFRLAEVSDLTRLATWIEDFHQEAVPNDPPVKGIEVASNKVSNKMIFVLEKEAELLFMAAWGRDLGSSCSINLVYTPPSLRKNGYGSIVTGQLTQRLLSDGKKEANLYTDLSNPTSNRIYQQLGYEFVCHSTHVGIS